MRVQQHRGSTTLLSNRACARAFAHRSLGILVSHCGGADQDPHLQPGLQRLLQRCHLAHCGFLLLCQGNACKAGYQTIALLQLRDLAVQASRSRHAHFVCHMQATCCLFQVAVILMGAGTTQVVSKALRSAVDTPKSTKAIWISRQQTGLVWRVGFLGHLCVI